MSSTVQRSTRTTSRRSLFKLAPVATGCAVLIVTSSAAFAQATAPDLNTVTVVGIRKGIEDAISIKKNSTSIVEAISAEDIGKLPDVSIAESIARMPGLAAQRVAGRAQAISVRGLSPDFATTLLNGREMVSTGDNRSAEFDQYPSELLSGVTIYKTPDAGLVGQGLSGTLDMQTVRPLNFKERAVSINVRGENRSIGSIADTKANGNRISVSYIDQFADRTVGLALGFAHLDSPILENQTGIYEPWKKDTRPGVTPGTYLQDGIKSLAKSGNMKRDGFMGVLEVKPSKNWTSVLDAYASTFKQVDTNNQYEVNLSGYNGTNPYIPFSYANPVISNGVLGGAQAVNVYPLVRGQYNSREDSINAIGWNNKFKFDGWSLLADVNYSKAKRNELYLENNTQLASTPNGSSLDTLSVNWANGGFPTIKGGLNYSDPTKLFTGNSIYGQGYGRKPQVEDELKGYKLVGTWPIASDFFSGVDFGLNLSDRSKKKRQPEGPLEANGTPAISSDLLYAPVDLGFSGSGIIPSWNVPGVVAKYFQPFNPSEINPGAISRAWDVKEKVTTSFVKADIESQWGSVGVRGNVGVQVINTDQSSASAYVDNASGGAVKPVSGGKTYTDVLPSMNLAFGLADQQTVRVAAAQQIARARIDQLRSSFEFNVDTTTRRPSASGGNPNLDPWRANAFDVSYEKYFGTKAYFAAAAYYKELKTYIYEESRTMDFSAFTPGTIAITNQGQYTAPYNGNGGTMRGIELSASLPLNMLTPALDGFGLSASMSYNDSAIRVPTNGFNSSTVGTDTPLPGLSKNVSNLTVYYEKGGWSTRVSQRNRSEFIGEIGNFAGDRSLRWINGEKVVDFQVGYNFTEGSMKGLGLVLQVNNLTDSPYSTYADAPDHPLEYMKFGTTYLFGLNYKF
jgi:iron complex outermembrane receptor protein